MNELKYFLLKTKFENQKNKKDDTDFFELVKNKLNWKEYLTILSELDNKDFFENGERHILSEYGLSTLQQWENFFTQKEKDEKAERFKLHNESIMSGWKRKTFWAIFIFGLFGGVYSGIDLFNKITSSKEVQKEQLTKQEMEEELTKLRTLILTQKKADSLNHSNSELYK
jgi:hypothetical protein